MRPSQPTASKAVLQPDLDRPKEVESRNKSRALQRGLRLVLANVRSQGKGNGPNGTQAGNSDVNSEAVVNRYLSPTPLQHLCSEPLYIRIYIYMFCKLCSMGEFASFHFVTQPCAVQLQMNYLVPCVMQMRICQCQLADQHQCE